MPELIPIPKIALCLIPFIIVVYVQLRWSLNYKYLLLATARMVLQLVIVGYFLLFIFDNHSIWGVGTVLFIMMTASSIIAIRHLQHKQVQTYFAVFLAIFIGGFSLLVLVSQFVLTTDTYFEPRIVIPIAGMIFANAMNCISLASERYESEVKNGKTPTEARSIAYRASLIPNTNTFIAVGLVSLPGMMTGQILSGVSPLIAARYQIVIMLMVFSSSGISAAIFLQYLFKVSLRDNFREDEQS